MRKNNSRPRLNHGRIMRWPNSILASLLSQQKSEDARKVLLQATENLPRDPYGWYNLGLVYKDIGEHEKAIEAFQHVAQIVNSCPANRTTLFHRLSEHTIAKV